MAKVREEQIGESDRYHREPCDRNADKPSIAIYGRTLTRVAYMYLSDLFSFVEAHGSSKTDRAASEGYEEIPGCEMKEAARRPNGLK